MVLNFWKRLVVMASLWRTLVAQDLSVRYRGTLLGRAWPLAMPLMMLALYGFVFGAVFRARWPGLAENDDLGFTLNLFTGLMIHSILAESVGQAPTLMQRNSNFVRKMVFPLPVLVAVPLGSALVHALIGIGFLLLITGVLGAGWHWSMLAVPIVMLPYLVMLYGLALAFAALGVYVRDLGQITLVLVVAALFTGAVFFPMDMVPPPLAGVVHFNPISWPTEAMRNCILHGAWPDVGGLSKYSAASVGILGVGWWMFATLRRGFADLL